MVKHNNIVPNQHFHKQWQKRVKCMFNQPMRKKRRRLARKKKAQAIAPRPASGALRPQVRCQTRQYNYKVRSGRGFTFDELKEAGISPKEARGLGIAVDHRRKNRSVEGFQANVQRLKAYKARLVIFPRRRGQFKKGDSTKEECANAQQLTGEIIPIVNEKALVNGGRERISAEMVDHSVFMQLRQARADKKWFGKRNKPAED